MSRITEELLSKLRAGEEVRANLISLRAELKKNEKERSIVLKFLRAEGNDRAQGAGVSKGGVLHVHVGEQLGKERQQTTALACLDVSCRLLLGTLANLQKQMEQLIHARKGGGVFNYGGKRESHGKGVHKLGHQVGAAIEVAAEINQFNVAILRNLINLLLYLPVPIACATLEATVPMENW